MKLMIASDLHGSAYYAKKLMDAYAAEAPDKLLLLGDLLYHGPRNALPEGYDCMAVAGMLNSVKDRIVAVRGNCDCEIDQMVLEFPMMGDYALLCVNGLTLYATHGHLWDAVNPPPMAPGAVLLNGHFHVPTCEQHDGFLYVNPGSTSIPKDGSVGSYLVLEDQTFTWKDMDGHAYKSFTVPFLETPRLILRRFREEDFPDFRVIAMDEERNHMMANPQVSDEAEARNLFHWLKDKEPRDYAVVLRSTGRVVGDLTVYDRPTVSDRPELTGKRGRELSFSIAGPYRRQGLIEEALNAVIAHLFEEEGADYIASGYFDFNEPSRRLHEKLGFTQLDTGRVRLPDTGEEAVLINAIRWRT